MTIFTMPPRSRDLGTHNGSPTILYRDLRLQGVAASEAWRRVRGQFPEPPRLSPQEPDFQSDSRTDVPTTSVNIYEDNQATIWGQIGWGPVLLTVVSWLLEQVFWALVWIARIAVRIVIGLLWFTLGFVVGFRMFSRR